MFLTSLIDGDITLSGAYKRHDAPPPPPQQQLQQQQRTAAAVAAGGAGGKVNRVCALVRGAIAAVAPDRLLISTLTSHVRWSPPDLAGALRIVLERARAAGVSFAAVAPAALAAAAEATPGEGGAGGDEEEEGEEGGAVPVAAAAAAVVAAPAAAARGPSWEAALRHVIVLSDVGTLYRTALGAYDVDLAALVAAHAQMDPREYVPLLRGLRALPPPWRAVRIDAYLARPSEMLASLRALATGGGWGNPQAAGGGAGAGAAAAPVDASSLAPGVSGLSDVLRVYGDVAIAAGRAHEALRALPPPARGGGGWAFGAVADRLTLEVARLAEARGQWSDACVAYLTMEPPRVCVRPRARHDDAQCDAHVTRNVTHNVTRNVPRLQGGGAGRGAQRGRLGARDGPRRAGGGAAGAAVAARRRAR
jgi:hypothetical protein